MQAKELSPIDEVFNIYLGFRLDSGAIIYHIHD